MLIYAFKCMHHGEFEVWQELHASHGASCPVCHRPAGRIFSSTSASGDLPNKDRRMGKTRAELLDNLAVEGMGNKDWRASYELEDKRVRDVGYKVKPMVGWTSALE